MDRRFITIASLGVAAVLLFIMALPLVPWAKAEESFAAQGASASFEVSVGTWSITTSGTSTTAFGDASNSETVGIYDPEAQDAGDVGLLRVGAPFLVIALVATVAAVITGLMVPGKVATITTTAAALLTILALVLLSLGTAQFLTDGDVTWHAGLYLTIAAALGTAVGAVNHFTIPKAETTENTA